MNPKENIYLLTSATSAVPVTGFRIGEDHLVEIVENHERPTLEFDSVLVRSSMHADSTGIGQTPSTPGQVLDNIAQSLRVAGANKQLILLAPPSLNQYTNSVLYTYLLLDTKETRQIPPRG